MKAQSDKMPIAPYAVEKVGTMADIRFCENVIQSETEDGTCYEYDAYSLAVEYTEELTTDLAQNTAVWLQKAKDAETPIPVPKSLEDRMEEAENKVVTIEQTIDVLFWRFQPMKKERLDEIKTAKEKDALPETVAKILG